MFSFLNKFMLRSLFIKSLFILVLPLSAEFAMNEKDSTHVDGFTQQQNIPIVSPTENNSMQGPENNNNMQGNINTNGAEGKEDNTEYLRSTPVGEDELEQGGERKDDYFKVKNVKVCTEKDVKGESGDEYKEKYFKKMRKYEIPFHSVKATVGFFERAYGYSKDVELNCSESLIFFYRRATFLFFCPLLFNSLLNFIFEIDNKPSGRYFNFFSVGWRTLPFLKIITFDIHFNWFLFAVSAWFDFVYFPTGFKNKDLFSYSPHKLSFIPMFLFAFVFDAVSLCVNFKVDDYFYITVNLSYVLQEIVGSLLYRRVKNLPGTESSVCGYCTICTERNLKTFLNEENKGNVDILQYNSGLANRPVINSGNNYRTVENIANNKVNLNNININTNTNTNIIYNEGMNNLSFRNKYIPYNSGYFGGGNYMDLQINNNIINNREDGAKNNNLFQTFGASNNFINNGGENIDNTNNGANINIINNNSKLIDVNFQKDDIEENNINNDMLPPVGNFAGFKKNLDHLKRKEENIEGNNNPEDNKKEGPKKENEVEFQNDNV